MAHVTPFTVFNLIAGGVAAVGVLYLLYTQFFVLHYRRFLSYLGAGLLIFSVGGPVVGILVPEWIHLIHGIAAIFVVAGLYSPVHNDLRTDEWVALIFQDPGQVRNPEEWMRPMDERILEVFHSSRLVLTPAIVAYNIDYSKKAVNRRLTELADHDFVERVDRGKYRMTEIGEHYLQGRHDAETENHQTQTGITDR